MASETKLRGNPRYSLAVITPVGPGHGDCALNAQRSVLEAGLGDFESVEHIIVNDPKGELGRSKARNLGIESATAEWLFFLDADDRMMPNALSLNDFRSPATFGAISLDGTIYDQNVYPCTFPDIAVRGANGTLAMGFFCKRSIAERLKWNEDMDAGEDFEFYLRLPNFTKRPEPFVDIGYKHPSAHGPRGYGRIDWTAICNREIREAIAHDPEKFDLPSDAVLAAT